MMTAGVFDRIQIQSDGGPNIVIASQQVARMRARWLAMTINYTFPISPRDAPEFCSHVPPSSYRGRRECRAPDAPAASRVEKTRELVTTVTPGRPAFPAQWF
jgi:hypothetical protein